MMKNPAHPGKVLKMMYIEPMELTIKDAAAALDMPRTALSEIVNCKRNISPAVAQKLAKAFDCRAQFWLDMQASYDLAKTEIDLTRVKVLYESHDEAALKML